MRADFIACLSLVALLAGTSSAGAQQPPPVSAPALPPSPAALSVPNPLPALKPGPRDLYRSPDGSDRFQHLSPHPAPPTLFFPGAFGGGPFYVPWAGVPDFPARPHGNFPTVPARGGLAIETTPETADVYVNGFYVAQAKELGIRGRPLDLAAGAYRVEVRAAGHEPLVFNAMIASNDIFRYRGDLHALSSRPVVVVPSRPPVAKQLYVIPNCYAGDKPPRRPLPPGCDPKKLRTQ